MRCREHHGARRGRARREDLRPTQTGRIHQGHDVAACSSSVGAARPPQTAQCRASERTPPATARRSGPPAAPRQDRSTSGPDGRRCRKNPHEPRRPGARHLIGNVPPATLDVLNLGRLHGGSVTCPWRAAARAEEHHRVPLGSRRSNHASAPGECRGQLPIQVSGARHCRLAIRQRPKQKRSSPAR